MNIQLVSDLHIDVNKDHRSIYNFIDHANKVDVLCIAGDLASLSQLEEVEVFFDIVTSLYKKVLYVVGNHEYYQDNDKVKFSKFTCLLGDISHIKSYLETKYPNLSILDKSYYIHDNVAILGCTLWTNIDNSNPIYMVQCSKFIQDYRYIYRQYDSDILRVLPEHTIKQFNEELLWITETTKKFNDEGFKTVWLTHHPYMINGIFNAINPKYHNSPINYAFASEPTYPEFEYMETNNMIPDIMMYGHTHYNVDFELNYLGESMLRYVSNSYGYGFEHGQINYKSDCIVCVS